MCRVVALPLFSPFPRVKLNPGKLYTFESSSEYQVSLPFPFCPDILASVLALNHAPKRHTFFSLCVAFAEMPQPYPWRGFRQSIREFANQNGGLLWEDASLKKMVVSIQGHKAVCTDSASLFTCHNVPGAHDGVNPCVGAAASLWVLWGMGCYPTVTYTPGTASPLSVGG